MASFLRLSKVALWLDQLGLRPYVLKLRDYLYHPRRATRYDLAIRRDYLAFRKQSAAMLQRESLDAPRKRALIVSLSPLVYRIKLEIFLARALHMHGYQPFFLTYRSTPVPNHPTRYFDAVHFGTTLFLEDFQRSSASAHAEIQQVVEHVLNDSLTVDELQHFQYRGVDVGEHVLSSLSRTLHMGRIDLARPDAATYLRRVLPQALTNVHAAEELLDSVQPDLLVFNDTSYTHYGPIHDISLARGINAFQFAYCAEDDALILKRCTDETRRSHPNSLSDESWGWAKRMPWPARHEAELQQHFQDRYGGRWFMSQRNQHNKVIKTRQKVQEQLGLDPRKKTVVLFSHILWDANLFYGEDLFEDFGEWFLETVRAAYANPAVNWVVKLHPGNVWKRIHEGWDGGHNEVGLIQSRLGPLPPHVRLLQPETDLNTRSLFDVADYAVTVRGTTGIELSSFGIPVFTAGTGRYSGLGFTIDSNSRDEYLQRLRHIQDYPPMSPEQTDLAKRYAYALFVLRPWRFTSMKSSFLPVEQGNHPLAWDLAANGRWPQNLAEAPDLKAFVDWVEDRDRIDYLGMAPEADNEALHTGIDQGVA